MRFNSLFYIVLFTALAGCAAVPPPPAPAPQPVAATLGSAHGNIGAGGMVAPGTFVLALVFLTSFVLYYFVNWKYLSTVWPLK